MANFTFDGLERYGGEIPKQFYCSKPYMNKYYLREQQKRIHYTIYDKQGSSREFYYILKIVGLVTEQYTKNIVIGYNLLPFGMLVGIGSWEFWACLDKALQNYCEVLRLGEQDAKDVRKKIMFSRYSNYRVSIEKYNDILEKDFVGKAIQASEDSILLKIDLSPELKTRRDKYCRGLHFLVEDLFIYNKIGKERMLKLFINEIFEIATSFFNYKITQKQRKHYIDILRKIANLTHEWTISSVITDNYKNSLREFMLEYRYARRTIKKYMECDKVFDKRKSEYYEPLKEFFYKPFDDLIKYLMGKMKIKLCRNCFNVIKYKRKVDFCTLEAEGRDCRYLYNKWCENRRREKRLVDKSSQ